MDYYKSQISITWGGGKGFQIGTEPRKTSEVIVRLLFLDLNVGKY